MVTQGNAIDTLQAVHLKNSQRADVLLHNSHVSPEYSSTDMTMHCKDCILTGKASPRGPDVDPSETMLLVSELLVHNSSLVCKTQCYSLQLKLTVKSCGLSCIPVNVPASSQIWQHVLLWCIHDVTPPAASYALWEAPRPGCCVHVLDPGDE